jgi:hypothetical protein
MDTKPLTLKWLLFAVVAVSRRPSFYSSPDVPKRARTGQPDSGRPVEVPSHQAQRNPTGNYPRADVVAALNVAISERRAS